MRPPLSLCSASMPCSLAGEISAQQEEADHCLGLQLQAGMDQHVLTGARCHAQVTLWNFLKYNVAGGGDSSLYGVESATFYLRNALTNLNLVLPLALLVPLSALFLMSKKRGDPARHPLSDCLAVLSCTDGSTVLSCSSGGKHKLQAWMSAWIMTSSAGRLVYLLMAECVLWQARACASGWP